MVSDETPMNVQTVNIYKWEASMDPQWKKRGKYSIVWLDKKSCSLPLAW